MKFVVSSTALLNVLQTSNKVVSNKNTLPILDNFLFELKDGGGEVEELLGAGLPFDLLASRNDLCASLERVLSGVLPGDRRAAAPPEEGASRGPGFRLPVGKKPRRRRKEAPCL